MVSLCLERDGDGATLADRLLQGIRDSGAGERKRDGKEEYLLI